MVIAKRQRRPQFVVCGDGPLAFRVSFALSTRYQGDVTVILPDAGSKHGAQMAALDHVTVVESLRPDTAAFRRARLDDADAVALLDQDDAGNIETALLVNELKPGVRLVVRFFDDELGAGIADHLPNCDVLSASKIAAPPLVALALGEARHLEVPGIDLVVGKPSQLPGRSLFTLAALRGEDSVMLPDDDEGLDRRIAIGVASPDPAPATPLRRPNGRVWYFVRQNLNKYVWYALAVLALVIVAGTTLVALTAPAHWMTALYQVVLETLAGADPGTDVPPVTRGVQVVVTVISVAVIPLLTAALVDAVVRARLAAAVSGPGSPMSGHVVVVGLGDVGTRVLATLLERGIPAVAVNVRDDGSRGIPFAREHGVPVVIGDGRRTDVLKAAQIGTARAVMAMTSDDVANIGISIAADSVDRDPAHGRLRRVLRLFDEDFARRVQGLIPRSAPRSASALASPAFAASVMGPDVLDTVPFRDRVLLVAEVPMHARCELEHRPARDVDVPGQVRLLAVRRPEKGFTTDVFRPATTNPLQHNHHLIVIATRTGLERLRARTARPEE
ncbi:NAD-binding protein [Myceligenerans pegani]|uniref:NAD-binding protein n=1 Tax=Myceligenerans pegani TaxID=2776917 RepID=A0ABR9N0Z1_9MICO|nr:NAD-binding protein [Myceligenerans sp. TRM 65318]MBE1876819.1 NAD-binding protein [Myceligenerans sp. TRM 65318]MBE3019090.1 NAD-binding protein [Myceligenerans sp. TRM 65318]